MSDSSLFKQKFRKCWKRNYSIMTFLPIAQSNTCSFIKQIIIVLQQKYNLLLLDLLRNNWNEAEAKAGSWASRRQTTAFCLKDKASVIKSNFCSQSYWNKNLRPILCWIRVYLSGRLNMLWWMYALKCSISSFSLIPSKRSYFNCF